LPSARASPKRVTSKDKQESFHLARWNIRDFGACKIQSLSAKAGYIAEILSAFDLIAVQEVNENMTRA